jgi:hypothetical protein
MDQATSKEQIKRENSRRRGNFSNGIGCQIAVSCPCWTPPRYTPDHKAFPRSWCWARHKGWCNQVKCYKPLRLTTIAQLFRSSCCRPLQIFSNKEGVSSSPVLKVIVAPHQAHRVGVHQKVGTGFAGKSLTLSAQVYRFNHLRSQILRPNHCKDEKLGLSYVLDVINAHLSG